MFTFVIWAAELFIMGWIAIFDLGIIAVAYDKNWLRGSVCLTASIIGWYALLRFVFLAMRLTL
jgi:hypothetical protein